MHLSFLRKQNTQRSELHFFALEHWSPMEWGCALAGEVGELCNKLKRLDEPGGKSTTTITEVGDEIADVLIYLDLLAARLRINLDAVTVHKFNAVSDRIGSTIKLNL